MTDRTRLDRIAENARAMIAVPYCWPLLRERAEAWLSARGTERERAAAEAFAAALEAGVMPIDGLIAFVRSEMGAQIVGAETAAEMRAHAEALRARGAKFCDCPACTAALSILAEKDALLG